MKIEVEVSEELIIKLGKEAIESYLGKKAEQLLANLQKQSFENSDKDADEEATKTAWQKFNKRGMSC